VLSRLLLAVTFYVCICNHICSGRAVSTSLPRSVPGRHTMGHRGGKKTAVMRHGRPRRGASEQAEVRRQETAKAAALSLALPEELAEARRRSLEGRYPGGAAKGKCPYSVTEAGTWECRWCTVRRFRQCRRCGHDSYAGNYCCLRWSCPSYAHSYAVAYASQLEFPLVCGRWDAKLAGHEWLSG